MMKRSFADSLAAILSHFGYETFAAYNGKAALEQARIFEPDFLVTDVMMPVMNGIELAIQIRDLLPACKVILFSGMAVTSALVDDAKSRGHYFEVLPKPVQPKVLLAYLTGTVSGSDHSSP
jgi:CheY-like chemotaxis protein